jgi:hypothetical protein
MLSFISRSVGLLALVGCSGTVATPLATETPSKQFILHGVKLEQRQKDRVVWTGSLQRADGDLLTTEASDIKLVRHPAENERPLRIDAKSGTLELDQGRARLLEVQFIDAQGNTLRAPQAFYDEKPGTMIATGPLVYTANGIVAHANGAVVYLKENRVDIAGPISGNVDPDHASLPPLLQP